MIVACWRTAEGYLVKPWFLCPQEAIDKTDSTENLLGDEDGISSREASSGAPYRAWHEDGLITATASRRAQRSPKRWT